MKAGFGEGKEKPVLVRKEKNLRERSFNSGKGWRVSQTQILGGWLV